MKIGLYADPHLCTSSSIITGRDGQFSRRLSNIIQSFTWMNQLFKIKDCDLVFCLGDMTDRPNLTAEEITALSKCNVSQHRLIIGNHCRSDYSGKFNSLAIFDHTYSEPQVIELDNCRVLILPYSHEITDLSQYENIDLILSHNDIKGYNYGKRVSTEGYEIEDILNNCKLFINGHLHNGGWVVKDRIVNLGQLTGMNFASCGGEWRPSVGIYDTETGSLEIVENPCAYKFDKDHFDSLANLKSYLGSLVGDHYVIQVVVPYKIIESARKIISQSSKIDFSRVVSEASHNRPGKESFDNKKMSTDHRNPYDSLREFIKTQKLKIDQGILNKVIDQIESSAYESNV